MEVATSAIVPTSVGAPASAARRVAAWFRGSDPRSAIRGATLGAGIVGVGAILLLGLVSTTTARGPVSAIAVGAIALALVLGGLDLVRQRRPDFTTAAAEGESPPLRSASASASQRASWLAGAAVAIGACAAVQTWFWSGTSLAGGDITPPVGTAWLSHLFSPVAWTGSSLGAPNNLEVQSPWAAVLWIVHSLGGSAALAQRFWYTILFVGAGLAAFAFLRLLRLRPLPAALGAFAYIFSPYVLTVGINPVFLAALALLPALPSVVLATAQRRIRVPLAALLLAASAPVLGYVYENPPLAGMVVVTTVATAGLAAWLYGRRAGALALRALAVGLPLLLLASAYWIVPSLLALGGVASSQLSTTTGWAWTEGRANLSNGLWLNTTWAWAFPDYYPYAPLYSTLPLALVKYLLPAGAFAALPLTWAGKRGRVRSQRSRLVVASAAVAIFLIVLGTGTNAPGSVVFDLLYRLPFGWLLREPGRFLMVADLAYAAMVGVTLTVIADRLPRPALGPAVSRFPRAVLRLSAVLAGTGLALVGPGFPLAFGSVAPSRQPATLSSAHVRVPTYWMAMARHLDQGAPPGNLLVLPPDDFYQMPYRWGFYGSDGFITDLLARHVVDPNGQGYGPASAQLLSATSLVARSLLAGDWGEARRLVAALGTPDILVRGDVNAGLEGRHIVSPSALSSALLHDPDFRLAYRTGALELFALRPSPVPPATPSPFVTVNSATPDLRELSLFPVGTSLVSGPLQAGTPGVIQVPPVQDWTRHGSVLSTTVRERPGWRYRVALLSGTSAAPISTTGSFATHSAAQGLTERVVQGPSGRQLDLRLRARSQELPNGDFQSGLWGPVGDCNDAAGPAAAGHLHARVLPTSGPSGQPALELSASIDSACEAQPLSWHGGSLLLTLWVRHLGGAPPRLCVWELGPRRCASVPPLPATAGWSRYRAIIEPDPGATGLDLFLYADSPGQGKATTNEYAAASAYSLPPVDQPIVLATPRHPAPVSQSLRVWDASYSTRWI
ncbi:MAG: hypothetical protein ACRD0J_05415, partial [Acidimicrobiales bacterium]